MIYEYQCMDCGTFFTYTLTMASRLTPIENPCEKCGKVSLVRIFDSMPSFAIRGASAKNGYSSNIADIEKHTGKPYIAGEHD